MRKKIGKVEPVQKTWLSTRETMAYLDCSKVAPSCATEVVDSFFNFTVPDLYMRENN